MRFLPAPLILALSILVLLSGCATVRPAPAPWEAGFPDADTVRVAELRDGVVHAYLWLPRGPWAVHVVQVDEATCRPDLAAVKAGPPLSARATTSELARGALAAVNGDFFMIPGGTPVGAQVTGGTVRTGPGARPVYARDTAGGHWAGVAELAGFVAVPGDTVSLGNVNRPLDPGRHHPVRAGMALFDHWYGAVATGHAGALRLELLTRGEAGGGAGGGGGSEPSRGAGAGVVRAVLEPGDTVAVNARAVVLAPVGEAAEAWVGRRAIGDTVAWLGVVVPSAGEGGPAVEALGGFPLLVADGRGVYGEQPGVIESFGGARHPRTAVGWSAEADRLLWVVVDGRQAPYSVGMTLPELEWLLLRLGATDALNLDGGGSSTMVVRGRVANRPSDAEGERPVANALVLRGCRP